MLKYAIVLLALVNVVLCDFNLLLLHNNDIHGRFEETERNSGTCQPQHRGISCVGGFARTAHLVRKHREEAANGIGPNVLYLNAGDTFIGTIWYTIHTWNISAAFMNLLRPDVQCLGNHEFDKGTDELYRYISALKYPTIGGNLDFSKIPELDELIPKSVVLNVSGTLIGVIGHLTTETQKISSPGATIFLDEIETVREESERLNAIGIKIIIVLGHSGYKKDLEIAAQVPLVDVVVGGHTNTFLWNGPQPDTEVIEDVYPKVVIQEGTGKRVPVVQAYAYTKYLGRLNLTFDDAGNLKNFYGQPVLLVNSIHQDEDFLQLLETYRPAINEINKKQIGTLDVVLDGAAETCRKVECNFGNLIADAFVLYKAKMSPVIWTEAPIGLINGGNIRSSISPGLGKIVVRGELMATFPYGNQVISLKLTGEDLIKTLELGIRSNGETSYGEFLQVSGLRVVYDRSKPPMSRVVSVYTRCGSCDIPTYQPIDLKKNYTIITVDYITNGFDGHYILKEKGFDKKLEDISDIDVLQWYFQTYSPVFAEVSNRITFVNNEKLDKQNSSVVYKPISVYILLSLIVYLFVR